MEIKSGGDMIIYISGGMTGIADLNEPAFRARAELLRKLYPLATIVVPHDAVPLMPGASYEYYLRKCIARLTECTHITMLPRWHNSNGARIENFVAEKLGIARIEI